MVAFCFGRTIFYLGLPLTICRYRIAHNRTRSLMGTLSAQLLKKGVSMHVDLIEGTIIIDGMTLNLVLKIRVRRHQIFQSVMTHHTDVDGLTAAHSFDLLVSVTQSCSIIVDKTALSVLRGTVAITDGRHKTSPFPKYCLRMVIINF